MTTYGEARAGALKPATTMLSESPAICGTRDGQENSGTTVIFFDGSCPLCRTEIEAYGRRNGAGQLRLVDVSAENVVLPQGLSRDQANARFHVLSREGRLISGAAAFIEVWNQLPSLRWAAWLSSHRGTFFMLESAYRLFLLMRPRLVRWFVFALGRSGRPPQRDSLQEPLDQ